MDHTRVGWLALALTAATAVGQTSRAASQPTAIEFHCPPLDHAWLWWELNRDAFVAPLPAPAGRQQLAEELAPLLLRAQAGMRTADCRCAVLLALARLRTRPDEVLAVLREAVRSPDPEVAADAALALGVLGDARALDELCDLVARAPLPRTRVFAAHGLAILTLRPTTPAQVRDRVRAVLLDLLDGAGRKDADLGMAAVTGLRVLRDPSVLPALAAAWSVAAIPPAVRAQIPGAVAALLPAASSERKAWQLRLAQAVCDRSIDATLREASALALGELGATEDAALDLIVPAATAKDTPATVRSLLLFSLARTGTARGQALALELLAGPPSNRAGWIALGLAIGHRDRRVTEGGVAGAGWRRHEATDLVTFGTKPDVPAAEPVLVALRAALDQARYAEHSAALGLSLGLLGDRASIPVLRERATRHAGIDGHCGWFALASSLLDDRLVVLRLEGILRDAARHSGPLARVAEAMTRLGAGDRVRKVVEPLLQDKRLAMRVAAYDALARGNAPTLLAHARTLLADESSTELDRAFCLGELARVLDPDPIPWTAVIARGAYAWGASSTLRDNATGNGVLDVR